MCGTNNAGGPLINIYNFNYMHYPNTTQNVIYALFFQLENPAIDVSLGILGNNSDSTTSANCIILEEYLGTKTYVQTDNYLGTNYRDLVSLSFTQNTGEPGVVIPANTYKPITVFTQPPSAKISYINFALSNTDLSNSLIVNKFALYDLSGKSYNFESYDPSATLLWKSNSPYTISSSDANIIKVFESSNIAVNSYNLARPLGIVMDPSGGGCRLFSVGIGYSS
jgi:hypothetical protein